MPTTHDALFRQTFADPQHAAALLAAVLPKALAAAADWSTLTRLPGCRAAPEPRAAQADLQFSLQVAGRTVLVHVVVAPESADPWTAFRILQGAVAVQDAFHRDHPAATTLPPIVPVVVHHGPRGFRAARCAFDLVDLGGFPPAVQKVLAPLQPNLHFLLDDLAALPEERLRGRCTGPQATLTLLLLQFLRQAREPDPLAVVERWLPLWRAVQADPGGGPGLAALLSYLAQHVEADRERFVRATLRIHAANEALGRSVFDRALAAGRAEGRAR